MNLTRLAHFNYQGFTFVPDKKLEGRKYGEQFKGESEIRVPPEVYDLLASDLDAVAKNLNVRIMRRRRRI